jgi:hypothetical protein
MCPSNRFSNRESRCQQVSSGPENHYIDESVEPARRRCGRKLAMEASAASLILIDMFILLFPERCLCRP